MGDDPSKELNLATYISAGVSILTCGVAAFLAFKDADASFLKEIGFKMIDDELNKIPLEKVRNIAKQNIEDIKNSNRRDFRF